MSQLCYGFFRLGKAVPEIPAAERMLFALFLMSKEQNSLLAEIKPAWSPHVSASLAEKISLAYPSFTPEEIFPWHDELSIKIEPQDFCASFLVQPDLFIRLRPGYERKVRSQLTNAGIDFVEAGNDSLELSNNTRIDTVVTLDKEAVVQDLSSQKTGELLRPLKGKVETIWDCCAASGGKSLMANDILGGVQITVSDIRASIIVNLKKRFAAAGINKYESIVADLTSDTFQLNRTFDLVLAGVPCTGGGAWGRTPEQLYYFNAAQIEVYASRQQRILKQATNNVRKGGYILYCTCSVFKKENELQVDRFVADTGWTVLQSAIFTGYQQKADTLFAALLQKAL